MSRIYAVLSVKSSGLKMCECKYQVCLPCLLFLVVLTVHRPSTPNSHEQKLGKRGIPEKDFKRVYKLSRGDICTNELQNKLVKVRR